MRKLFSNWKIRLLFSLIFLTLALLFLSLTLKSNSSTNKNTDYKAANIQQSSEPEVLGSNYIVPQIFLSGREGGYASGGLIALASTDEPEVVIGGYDLSGEAEISMYEADENTLIDYLLHDKDGKQIKKGPDISTLRYITSTKQNINTASYQNSRVPLPFKETGIWYLQVKVGPTRADAFVLRSDIGVLTKEGDNEFIFWGQNFKTKRSISAGTVKILNLQDQRKELQMSSFNAEGIARANLTPDADIALIAQDNNRAIVPINLKYLNTGYSYKEFQAKAKSVKYFIFTDRPLYKPGDTVYFKSILRDDDDVRYTIPSENVLVKIYSGYGEKEALLEKSLPVSSDGTISGEYKLPANAKTGYYTLSVDIPTKEKADRWDISTSSSVSFNVEFFRKPEFSIDVTTPNADLIASDKTSFKINGTYFSGQPLIGQEVKYTVYSADFYEYQYLADQQNYHQNISSDYRYGYWYGNNKATEGTATLDKKGEAVIDLETKMSWNKGKTQVFSIEAVIEDGSQNPSFSRKNILVYAGEYGIYRKDTSFGAKVNTPLSVPLALVPYRNNYQVANRSLTAKIKRTNWVSYQEPNNKYPSYKREDEDLPDLSAKTDKDGNADLQFTPAKVGSYAITVEGQDSKGNLISKTFYSYVSSDDQPYYSENGDNELTISTDKQQYLPTDTVKFNIFSQTPDRDVFLSLERGRVNDFKIVRLNGKNGSIDIPLVNTDIPNIYAKVSSFSRSALDSKQTNVIVSPDSKKLVVNITPDSKTFGPGETVTVNVETSDIKGNPISADLALWSVDKAIFELSDNSLGDIFNTFWQKRSNNTNEAHSLESILVRTAERGGGCFGEGTKVLMGDGTLKNIEEVNIGDYVLTKANQTGSKLIKARVLHTHSTSEGGYLIINGNLKVTANHIIWVNNTWKEAGSIQIGDALTNSKGEKVNVSSIEWQRGKANVYNLEIEKYHTFFANGVWVHNEKGMDRNAFKDTAYWNPSIHTDSSGRAQVSFKLPDNLTTWTLAAVASTQNTMVGQATNEIIATKDVIVRPVLPNILRVGDEILLSALVQNFTQSDHQFDIGLKFDSGSVEQETQPETLIKSNGMEQFYFKVKPEKESSKSKLIFSAKTKEDSKLADILTQEIPVKAFGFEEKRAEAAEGAKTFSVNLAPDSQKDKSKIVLSLSPTIVGTLPTAMKYLVDYPYGCVEQTTSRFVPAVIAKLNQDMFPEALKDKDIDGMVEKGLSRLLTLQQSDGGWAWWYQGKSDAFITAYVVEYILKAKEAGIKVDGELIERAKGYLQQNKAYDTQLNQYKPIGLDEEVIKNYALTLLEDSKAKQMPYFGQSPDILSLAVMANYLNGNTDPEANGLNRLISLAQPQGDALFWGAGNKLNFGSKDASTALAIRAIVLAKGDRDLAVKGARYLTRIRQSNYWSNTFATAQVIRALVELSKTGEELTPDYTYAVLLDGKQIAQGKVSNAKQVIPEINIPTNNINPGSSSISISKTGDGQIYSTLAITEFHTDKNAQAVNRGLTVKREYENAKGPEYSLGVGDTAIVKITVGGLKTDENYGVINDELPSGLIPINQSFKNEQYGNDSKNYYSSYDVTDREVTENGMILSLYQIAPVERTYTYKARVVSEGTFIVPPATVSLMYAPEINGRSEVQTIKIAKQSQFVGTKSIQKPITKFFGREEVITALWIFAITAASFIFALRRQGVRIQDIKKTIKKAFKRDNSVPPPSNQPGQAQQ